MKNKLLLVVLMSAVLVMFSACGDSAGKEDSSKPSDNKKVEQKDDNKKADKKDKKKADKKDKKKGKKKVKEGFTPGKKPYDFEITSLDGETYKLSDYLGKNPIIVKYMSSTCGPCRKELPHLNKVYKENKDKGLIVLGIDLAYKDSEKDVRKLVEKENIEFPILMLQDKELVKKNGVTLLPVNMFIGKDGIVKAYLKSEVSEEQYAENLAKIME